MDETAKTATVNMMKEGAVKIQEPGFFVSNTLKGIHLFLEQIEQTLGGTSPHIYRIKTAVECCIEGKGHAIISCPCFAMQFSRYPLICGEHAHYIAGSVPSKYVVITKCENHDHAGKNHYSVVAFGALFGPPKTGDTQAGSEAFLDKLTCENDAAMIVAEYMKETEMPDQRHDN